MSPGRVESSLMSSAMHTRTHTHTRTHALTCTHTHAQAYSFSTSRRDGSTFRTQRSPSTHQRRWLGWLTDRRVLVLGGSWVHVSTAVKHRASRSKGLSKTALLFLWAELIWASADLRTFILKRDWSGASWRQHGDLFRASVSIIL